MCCMRLAENTGRKNDTRTRHLGTIAQLCRAISLQLRHVSTVWINLLNSNISARCPYKMVNFGPLAAEIGLVVWGTPANFNGFSRLGSITAQHSSIGHQPNWGIEQRVLPVFGRAAITLGIGPHSSLEYANTVWSPCSYSWCGCMFILLCIIVSQKKGATLTMAITLSILDRFAKFFHCCKEQ